MTSLRARVSTTGGLPRTRVPCLAAAGLVLALAGPSTAQTYTVGPIAGLGGGYTNAHAISESGQVTAVSPSLRTCNVVGWGNADAALQVTVECRDGTGAFADTPYDVLVIE